MTSNDNAPVSPPAATWSPSRCSLKVAHGFGGGGGGAATWVIPDCVTGFVGFASVMLPRHAIQTIPDCLTMMVLPLTAVSKDSRFKGPTSGVAGRAAPVASQPREPNCFRGLYGIARAAGGAGNRSKAERYTFHHDDAVESNMRDKTSILESIE